MAKKMKIGDRRPVRPLGDGFVYVQTKDDSGEAFRERMRRRFLAVQPPEVNTPTINVQSISRKRA